MASIVNRMFMDDLMFADDRMSMGESAKYTFMSAGGWMSMGSFISPPKKNPDPLQPAWPEMCRHAWTAVLYIYIYIYRLCHTIHMQIALDLLGVAI